MKKRERKHKANSIKESQFVLLLSSFSVRILKHRWLNAAEKPRYEFQSGTLSLTFEGLKLIVGINERNAREAGRIPL